MDNAPKESREELLRRRAELVSNLEDVHQEERLRLEKIHGNDSEPAPIYPDLDLSSVDEALKKTDAEDMPENMASLGKTPEPQVDIEARRYNIKNLIHKDEEWVENRRKAYPVTGLPKDNMIEEKPKKENGIVKKVEVRTALTQQDLDALFADFEKENGKKITLIDLDRKENAELSRILARQKMNLDSDAQEILLKEYQDLRKKIVTKKLFQMLSDLLDDQFPENAATEQVRQELEGGKSEDMESSLAKVKEGTIILFKDKEYRVEELPNEDNGQRFVLKDLEPHGLTFKYAGLNIKNALDNGEAEILPELPSPANNSRIGLLEQGVNHSEKYFARIKNGIENGVARKYIQEAITDFERLFNPRMVKYYKDKERAEKVGEIWKAQIKELRDLAEAKYENKKSPVEPDPLEQFKPEEKTPRQKRIEELKRKEKEIEEAIERLLAQAKLLKE